MLRPRDAGRPGSPRGQGAIRRPFPRSEHVRRAPAQKAKTPRRVHVDFTGEAYRTLHRIARETDKPVESVLGEAIALKRWARQVQAKGGRIYVEQNGKVRLLKPV